MSKISEKRRGEILEAAAAEFTARGLEAASMADIADRAGIGKSTIYEYFPSKVQLFSEVCTQRCEQLAEEFSRILYSNQHFRDKCLQYLLAFQEVTQGVDMRKLLTFLTSDPAAVTIAQETCQLRERTIRVLEQAVRQAQADGEISDRVDPMVAACFLLVLPSPDLLDYMKQRGVCQPEEKILDLAFHGLRKGSEAG